MLDVIGPSKGQESDISRSQGTGYDQGLCLCLFQVLTYHQRSGCAFTGC